MMENAVSYVQLYVEMMEIGIIKLATYTYPTKSNTSIINVLRTA